MTYQEKLNDPRWIARANEIKQRDNYTCQICGSKNNLHVHHILYQYDLDPWNYIDEALITLCSNCHKHEHECKDSINELIARANIHGMLHSDILNKMKLVFGILELK